MKILLLCVLFITACSSPAVNADQVLIDQANADRTAKFVEFQAFADTIAPGWSVISLRNETSTISDDGTLREQYYLILKKDAEEQVVYTVRAEFINKDGTTSKRIYRVPNPDKP